MEKHEQTLAELIHRELSKLPDRPAPTTLIPRVLAELQARAEKRWWQRPWTNWPRHMQIASLPFMVASACGTVAGVSLLGQMLLARLGLAPVSETLDSVSAIWEVLSVLGNAVVILTRAGGQPWLLAGVGVAAAMYLACVGLGTLCYRVASYNRSSAHE